MDIQTKAMIFAGCVAAAGAVYAHEEGLPNEEHVISYAQKLFTEAVSNWQSVLSVEK